MTFILTIAASVILVLISLHASLVNQLIPLGYGALYLLVLHVG